MTSPPHDRPPAVEGVLELPRRAFRAYGSATAALRPWPDFLVIGAKRGGTTSLYYDLLRHPQVVPLFPSARRVPFKRDDTKGVHYFDKHHERGPVWYRSHFPSVLARRSAGPGAVTGEASPYSLHHPLAAERAATLLPDLRLVALLRDPVERTYSHYREQVRNGVEQLSFEDALAAEPDRTAGAVQALADGTLRVSAPHEDQSYAAQSAYDVQLPRWLARFPRERLLVLLSEDYYRDPQTSLGLVAAHLGLPASPAPSAVRNAAPPGRMDPGTRALLRRRLAPATECVEDLLRRRTPWHDA